MGPSRKRASSIYASRNCPPQFQSDPQTGRPAGGELPAQRFVIDGAPFSLSIFLYVRPEYFLERERERETESYFLGSKSWGFSETEVRLCGLEFAALRRSSPSFKAKIEQPGFDFLFPVLFPTARRLPMCEDLCLVCNQDLSRRRFVYSPAKRLALSRFASVDSA
jgi:hypothetical protein